MFGKALTVMATVPGVEEVQELLSVTETLYVPASAMAALAIVGFCDPDEKVFGPAHE
jgi:hypothetical protein